MENLEMENATLKQRLSDCMELCDNVIRLNEQLTKANEDLINMCESLQEQLKTKSNNGIESIKVKIKPIG